MTNVSAVPNGIRKKLDFTYDHAGRRIAKTVSTWNGSVFTKEVTTRLINDGWCLVTEINSSGNPTCSYTWGIDFSGYLDGAGSVGGLLIFRDHAGGTYHFVASDGNGNVMALMNAADQTISARYEYSPYSELLRATGPMVSVNSICGGSKYWDRETKLSYYGYRYYSAGLGRWLRRDPTGEADTSNPFVAFGNNSINFGDDHGAAKVVYTGGHHIIPAAIIRLLDEGPTADLFNQWQIPYDRSSPAHVGFSTPHREYNAAVMARFNEFLTRHKITPK
jgi:RHS repeat-associated protein